MMYLGHSTLVIALFSASTLFGAEGGATVPSSPVPPVPDVKNADYYRGRLAQSELELTRAKKSLVGLRAGLEDWRTAFQDLKRAHAKEMAKLKAKHEKEIAGKDDQIKTLKEQLDKKNADKKKLAVATMESTAYVVFKLPQKPDADKVLFGGTSVSLSSEPVQMIQIQEVTEDRRVVFNYGSKQVGSILRPNAITIVDLNRMEVAAR